MDSELITFYGKILNKNKFYVDDVKVPEELYYKIKKKCEEERKIIEENQRLKEVIDELYQELSIIDDDIMKTCKIYDVNGIPLKKILDKVKGEDND